MARRSLVEVQCERCSRKESYDPETTARAEGPAFEAKMMAGAIVRFDDLCGPCTRTVRALVEQIGKKIDGMSPDRLVAPKELPLVKTKPKAKEKEQARANGHAPPATSGPTPRD